MATICTTYIVMCETSDITRNRTGIVVMIRLGMILTLGDIGIGGQGRNLIRI